MSEHLKKYKTSRTAMIVSILIDVVLLILYIITLYNVEKTGSATIKVVLDVISNILLVGMSVLSASLLAVPFIDVRGKNELFAKHILWDVFSSPEIFDILSGDQKKQMLKSLESNLNFNCNVQVEEMLSTVREKIQLNSVDCADKSDVINGCYFEKCSYEIECTIADGYIKKSILKEMDLRSYNKQVVRDFPLCSSTSANAEDGKFSVIENLSINDVERNVSSCVEAKTAESSNPFSKRCGYSKSIKYLYMNTLPLSPDKSTKISFTHKTVVPDNDISFSCRMKYPCHNFSFRFKLLGEAADNYNLIVNAFGFLEDGVDTPNRSELSEAKVSFNNWIFPCDGVAVALVKKASNSEVKMQVN